MKHPEHAYLYGLNEEQRIRLATGEKPFQAAPGEFLAREGDSADACYVIRTGQVMIGTHHGKHGTVPIQILGPGDVVGWSWLLPPYLWQFDARVAESVDGLYYDAAWLRDLCEHDYELGYRLLKQLLAVVSGRLSACRIKQLDIYN